MGQISPIMKNIAEGKVAASQLYSLIDRKMTLIEPEHGIKVNSVDLISLNNICFKYEKVDLEAESLPSDNSMKMKEKDE